MRRNTAGKLGLLAASVLVSLVVIETTLRLWSPPPVFSPLLPLLPNRRMLVNSDLRGVSPVARHTTNRWGLRGQEPPRDWDGRETYLAIGGSTTHCMYLGDAKVWTQLLQRRLRAAGERAWVGNGGIDGHTTRGHVVFMEEVVPRIKPKNVLVLAGINDLALSMSRDARAGSAYDGPTAGETEALRRLLALSRLAQIVHAWSLAFDDDVTVIDPSRHTGYQPVPLPRDADVLPADPREILPSLQGFRSNLERIADLAQRDGVRLYLITQPMLYEDTEEWRRTKGELFWVRDPIGIYSAADYWRLLQIFNAEMLSICRERGLECLDLGARMPHDREDFYDPVHFTEAGSSRVAEEIADFLLAVRPPAARPRAVR